MRRRDREMDEPDRVWNILRSSCICRLGLCGQGWPYVVPMNYGIAGTSLYLHCASEGLKLALLRDNPQVCFEVEGRVEVVPSDQACAWSVRYTSVIGFGLIRVVDTPHERRTGLAAVAAHAARLSDPRPGKPHGEPLRSESVALPETAGQEVTVLRIDVLQLTGKESDAA